MRFIRWAMDSGGMKNSLKPRIPRRLMALASFAYRQSMFFRCRYSELLEGDIPGRNAFEALPHPSLRYRVHGAADIGGFLWLGKLYRVGRQKELVQATLHSLLTHKTLSRSGRPFELKITPPRSFSLGTANGAS